MNSKIKISIFDIYMKLILILPITTLLQSKIDFVNRLIFTFIFLLQLAVIVYYPIKRKQFLLLGISVFVYIVGLINTSELKFDNSIVYYINWLFFSSVIISNKNELFKWIMNSKGYVYSISWIWTIAVFVSIFMPSSYYDKEGVNGFFCSYTDSIYRLAPTSLFIASLAVIMIYMYNERKAIAFMIVPLYCVLMGSSRTYFAIILLVAFIGFLGYSRTKKELCMLLVPCIAVFLTTFFSSSIYNKIVYMLNDRKGDFWYRITNSRNLIWERIFNAFNKLSLDKRFFGAGYGFTNNVANHYAHNDFIEILATHGYFGVILYIVSIVCVFKAFKNENNSILINTCVMGVWFINAMFNMFYYYTCAALSFPLLLMALSIKKEHVLTKEFNNEKCI